MRNFLRVVHVAILLTLSMSLSAQSETEAGAPATNRSITAPPKGVDTMYVAEAPQVPMLDYTAPPKQYVVNEINVHGARFLDPAVAARSSGLSKGDSIMLPSDYISSAIRKLWDSRFYSDVKVITEPVGDSVNIEVYLHERPRVNRWDIQGATKSEKTDLLEKLSLRRGGELSDFIIKNSTDVIRAFYEEKAFRNVDITVEYKDDPTVKNAINVTFVIDRKDRVRIGELDFEGNEVLTDKKLRSLMKKTHRKGINPFRSTRLKTEQYTEDKAKIIDYYNSQGYRNATILGDSIYPINEKRLGINITVEEGQKFYYHSIKWLGNTIYTTDRLNTMLGANPGDVYDRKSLHKQLGIGRETDPDAISVSSLYQNNGYLFSQVEPIETVVGGDSIDLEVRIYEGKQARINEVLISGNLRVDDKVIRRELYVRPGELYDRSLLMQTIRQLSQMQHFNPENLQPGIEPVTGELVNMSFPLEEQASDRFEVSGGWGYGMFVGSVGVTLSNFSMKNLFEKNSWTPYPSGQNQQLSIQAQTNGSYYNSVSLSFVEPWLGGKKPNSLNTGTYFASQSDGEGAFFRTLGISAGLGRRLSWPDNSFTLYNELSYQSYTLCDWTGFVVENGQSNIIAFTTALSRNTVDQPIYPRSGSEFSASVSLTPPYSLFDDKDYSDEDLSDGARYGWVEYHKWELKGLWYTPLDKSRKLVLMARAQMGYLGAYNPDKVSPFEGFDVGGDGISGYNVYGVDVIGLRGYDDSSLTPTYDNSYARAYNKYTIELRYPLMLDPSSTIFGLVFAEAGNAFNSWKDFDPFTIKRSMGAGVRIYLPIVGLFGVDWGYGFDAPYGTTEKSGSQVHFMIGQSF